MKKIVIIGSGVRECAILMKLQQSNLANDFNFITIGNTKNPYMLKWSQFYFINSLSLLSIKNLSLFNNQQDEFLNDIKDKVEFVIIGPEAPIEAGLTNWLEELNIFCIAPNKNCAKIETSKLFARDIINKKINAKYNPKYAKIQKNDLVLTKDDIKIQILKIKEIFNTEIVLKKDGLCGGKGVFVEGDHFVLNSFDTSKNSDIYNESNESNVINLFDKSILHKSGIEENEDNFNFILEDLEKYLSISSNSLIIEEKLDGIEFSLMSFVDSNGNLADFPPIFDFKKLEDDNKGPNTGSMGAILLNQENTKKIIEDSILDNAKYLNKEIVKAVSDEVNSQYIGVIYGSFIFSNNNNDSKLKIIEYNCRFGDPEGALALQDSNFDLIEIFYKIKVGTLCQNDIESKNKNIVAVYLVPNSYGVLKKTSDKNNNNYDIFFRNNVKNVHENNLNNIFENDMGLIYGSCNQEGDHLYSNTSRTLLLFSESDRLYKAYNNVYRNIDDIISNLKYRTDIGANFLTKYELAGVSIDNANSSLSSIKNYLISTYNSNVLSELGDFGGIYKIGDHNLVSSIDGVGTKTDFIDNYFTKAEYEGLGEDIVNHCINDILVMGAKPLFFLDYYGTSVLDKTQFNYFIKGASKALVINNNNKVPLIGGETAEMPSVYKNKKNDIVGCIIGEIDKYFINFLRKPKARDRLFAFSSDGPHTNGFSLINKINWDDVFSDNKLLYGLSKQDFFNELKTPHKNYFNVIEYFIEKYGSNSIINMCHITGGGLHENMRRVISSDLQLYFDTNVLDRIYPKWCKIIEEYGNVSRDEMYRVYNCGIGFVLILDNNTANKVISDKIFNLTEIGYLL